MAGLPVGWFSPTYKLMLDVWRDVIVLFQDVIARTNITERRIELITGGVIEFWPVDNANVARGRRYALVVIDEAAMMRVLKEAWENAIRPTLTDYEGEAWFFSTPQGRNYFWELYRRGCDPEITNWKAWRFASKDNPHIPANEIEQARIELPESVFTQEYEAKFLEHSGAVFRLVNEAATANRAVLPHEHKGHTVVSGLDWGKENDFTVHIGVCRECKTMVFMDRSNKIDYAFQVERADTERHRWKLSIMNPERNSMGAPIIEQLERKGMPIKYGDDNKAGFNMTATSKPVLIEELALAIERGELTIFDDPVLINELLAYERKTTASGRPTYNAPSGMHDDTVIALALAWNAALTSGINIRYM